MLWPFRKIKDYLSGQIVKSGNKGFFVVKVSKGSNHIAGSPFKQNELSLGGFLIL